VEIYNKHQKVAKSEETAKKIWQHLHFRLGVGIAFLCIASLSFYTIYLGGSEKVAPEHRAEADALKVGVFMFDPDSVGETMLSNDDLKKFDISVGRKTDIFLWYQSISESFAAAKFYPMADDGRTIQLAWEPDSFNGGVNQPNYQLKDIASGSHDQEIQRWAKELKDFGREILFRPMAEMNGKERPWNVGNTIAHIAPVNGNSPEDYIPAWRHIYDIFAREGATNVKFVWSPNRDGSKEAAQYTFDTYYPGDKYVDYVGLSGYNWGTMYATPEWTSSWQSFSDIFGPSYDTFSVKTAKPFMISETASTEKGGDKAAWVKDTYKNVVSRFPRVKSITWFNVNKETDWRLNSSPGSLTAYQEAMKYIGGIPPALTATLSSPTDNSSVAKDVAIVGTTSDNTKVSKVEFYVDNNLQNTATTPVSEGYKYVWNSKEVPNGSHKITFKSYDKEARLAEDTATVNVQNTDIPIYHFYNKYYNNYYTTDPKTANWIKNNLASTWWYQDIAFKAFSKNQTNTVPVYEFYIPSVKKHYYTANVYQKNYIMANLSGIWNYQGIAFYAYPKQIGETVPIYQYYNDFTKGSLYTTTPNILSKYAYSHYYRKIGIAFYAYPK